MKSTTANVIDCCADNGTLHSRGPLRKPDAHWSSWIIGRAAINSEKAGDGRDLNRRALMRNAASAVGALALPSLLPASALGAQGRTLPGNRITVAQIGLGVMGRGHVRRLSSDPSVELLALCDVDRTRLMAMQAAVSQTEGNTRPDIYNDYQEVLGRDDVDAVVIVTPDHWHTPIAVDAAKAGKDIYCEKPVSMTVREGRELEEAVRRSGRIFQTGTQ